MQNETPPDSALDAAPDPAPEIAVEPQELDGPQGEQALDAALPDPHPLDREAQERCAAPQEAAQPPDPYEQTRQIGALANALRDVAGRVRRNEALADQRAEAMTARLDALLQNAQGAPDESALMDIADKLTTIGDRVETLSERVEDMADANAAISGDMEAMRKRLSEARDQDEEGGAPAAAIEQLKETARDMQGKIVRIGHAVSVIAKRIDALEHSSIEQSARFAQLQSAPPLAAPAQSDEGAAQRFYQDMAPYDNAKVAPYIAQAEQEIAASARAETGGHTVDIFDRIAAAAEDKYEKGRGERRQKREKRRKSEEWARESAEAETARLASDEEGEQITLAPPAEADAVEDEPISDAVNRALDLKRRRAARQRAAPKRAPDAAPPILDEEPTPEPDAEPEPAPRRAPAREEAPLEEAQLEAYEEEEEEAPAPPRPAARRAPVVEPQDEPTREERGWMGRLFNRKKAQADAAAEEESEHYGDVALFNERTGGLTAAEREEATIANLRQRLRATPPEKEEEEKSAGLFARLMGKGGDKREKPQAASTRAKVAAREEAGYFDAFESDDQPAPDAEDKAPSRVDIVARPDPKADPLDELKAFDARSHPRDLDDDDDDDDDWEDLALRENSKTRPIFILVGLLAVALGVGLWFMLRG